MWYINCQGHSNGNRSSKFMQNIPIIQCIINCYYNLISPSKLEDGGAKYYQDPGHKDFIQWSSSTREGAST